jgi:hypothetical protein
VSLDTADAPAGRCGVTKSKGDVGQTPAMNASTSLTPATRDRAINRMRRITLGTALASTAAVAAFGSVAAISNPGQQAATTASATDTSSSSTTSGATSTSESSATLQPAPTAATSTSGRGQVTTGAS